MKTRIQAIPAVIALVCATGMTGAVAAEAGAAPLPKGIVAVVNNAPIVQSDVDTIVKASGQPDTPALRDAVKRDLIVRQLIEQAADKANYGSRPEVQGIVSRARASAAADLYLRDALGAQRVTDAQVKARYDYIVANAAQFEYRAEVVAVADAAKANAVAAELKQGAAFDAVAKKYNTTANAGVAEWSELKTPLAEGHTAGLPMPLAQAMTSLKPGAVSGPVQIGNAYAFVKLADKRPVVVPSFDKAKPVLRQQLEQQAQQSAMAALVDKLAAQATIEQ